MLRTSAVLLAVCAACGGDSPPLGTGQQDSPAVSETVAADGGTPEVAQDQSEPTCGGQSIPIERKPAPIPDLHLVVDKSGSMADRLGFPFGSPMPTKWTAMRETLQATVQHFGSTVRFGLTLFPSDGRCGPGQIDVPLELGNEAQITSALQAVRPAGNTPTATTLEAVRQVLVQSEQKSDRHILLATDGLPNCDPAADQATLAAVQRARAAGIKTFVVGFGEIFAADPFLLDRLAEAGGTATAGQHKFHLASDEEQLQQALFAIAGELVVPSCTYSLDSAPPEPDKVTVTFDGQAVARDGSHATGWDFTGEQELSFFRRRLRAALCRVGEPDRGNLRLQGTRNQLGGVPRC